MIGKWHLVSDPTGFDYWNILPGQGVYHDPDFITAAGRKKYPGYCTDLIGDFTLDWLKQRDPEKALLRHVPSQGAAPPLGARPTNTRTSSRTATSPSPTTSTTTTKDAPAPSPPSP